MSNTWVVPGPGFRICYDQHPDYLRAYVFDGTDSLEVSLAMWQILAAECEATKSKRLMVLEDLRSTVDQAGIEVVIDAISEMNLADMRVAFVELREDIQGAEFGEILCLERGIKARVFSHEVEARHWLIFGD
ncbi:hypothetical protein [Thermomonas sp.]|uniref:hypothetical protein n=1 Tax=Thermomonas sp. TaxID=1971895 RepID=UPI00248A2F9D|nr:hypothetical protein [Thermomonas sp.]MDI1253573.1 hypothetical protein [Thermomonas sp.]